ncbi:DNA translocase FtsK 4TM domain-containing protein [Alphaproteobacteria bacterium]|nr:DNA translocase FtsK 4TM domain-containing protein [Alphaproteobacteria bacterium]
MFKYGNFKSFVAKFIIGLLFSFISIFFFISLVSFDLNDPGYGHSRTASYTSNLGGFVGAYISSFFLVFFNQTSYLFSVFFGTYGIRLLLGIQSKFILVKFFSLILSMLLLNCALSIAGLDVGLVGSFSQKLFYMYFENFIINKVYYWFVLFVFFSLTTIFLLIALNIKNLYYKKILQIFYPLKYILKLFVLFFVYFIKKTNIIYNKKGSNTFDRPIVKKNNNKRSEPTIKKTRVRSFQKTSTDNLSPSKSDLKYVLPPISLLKKSNSKPKASRDIEKSNIEFSKKLETILSEYGVEGNIVNYKYGPVVTLYEFLPAAGIKTSKVVGLSDDIARAMSSLSTRISSQPGKNSIGIEIPNSKREDVYLGDLIEEEDLFNKRDGLTLALGKNISGEKKFTDLEKMPHLLIAGTTGSGKSVGINSMIISLLLKFTPSECKLILIDPKMLELSIYENIPHLLTPVVTNPNKAVFALKWVVREMENRYKLMSSLNVKNISSYNNKIISTQSSGRKLYREVQTGIDNETRLPIIEKKEIPLEKMPLIVVVIDEMADLMMVAGKEVENLVQRLAQMARASGIHLIAATQRPSVDVITGTIKANFPSRISFRVASRFDSRTILNEMGAEQLLGSGDMLFLENGASLNRLHGGFVSEKEIEAIVNHIKSQSSFENKEDITLEEKHSGESPNLDFDNKGTDELYDKAVSIVLEQQKVSTSFIQRYLQIGYNRAARIVEKMEEEAIISEASNSGKRNVLKKK